MTNNPLTLDHRNNIPAEYEGILFKGISKLGYSIEFVREGYDKDSKMYMLRKAL